MWNGEGGMQNADCGINIELEILYFIHEIILDSPMGLEIYSQFRTPQSALARIPHSPPYFILHIICFSLLF